MNKRALTTIAVGLGAALSSNAFTITHTVVFGPASPDASGFITVPQFNPLAGVLSKVTYDLGAITQGFIRFENLSPDPRLVTGHFSNEVSLDFPVPNPGSATAFGMFTHAEPLGPFDAVVDFGPPSGWDSGTQILNASDSEFITPISPGFGAFIGLGNINLPWDSNFDSGVDAGAVVFTSDGQFFVEAKVTYEFNDPIPETSTYLSALGLLGIGALGYFRRVRR